jgi:hypothetical protein
MSNLDFNGRGIVCVFYDWEERCWVRGASYYRGEETHFMYADDWEKYEAQRLLLEESMSFVTLEDDTAKLLLEHENNHEKAGEIEACTTKNWPENGHHDHYDVSLGWTFLGKDDKHDYYVNHAWEYLSIVYGGEDSQYKSPDYHSFLEGAYKSYPYAKLRELIQKEVKQ